MSRHNTRRKLRARLLKLLADATEPMTIEQMQLALNRLAFDGGYLDPEYVRIKAVIHDLKDKGLLEVMEPVFPPSSSYNSRELQSVWYHYARYRIPTLNRLAMLADEEGPDAM